MFDTFPGSICLGFLEIRRLAEIDMGFPDIKKTTLAMIKSHEICYDYRSIPKFNLLYV